MVWAVGRPTKCERPCAKRGIRAEAWEYQLWLGLFLVLIEVCGVSVLLHLLQGQFVSFYRLHRCGKCFASTGLHSISCFRHLFQSARSGCTHESFRLHECIPVLQFCCKSNAGYLLMLCYSPAICFSFVRLPDEFYVTMFKVAVASDGSRKYAASYSLIYSCCWQFDVYVK